MEGERTVKSCWKENQEEGDKMKTWIKVGGRCRNGLEGYGCKNKGASVVREAKAKVKGL
jgi:hypothetical protein